jgi:hypothetical protein
MTWASPVCGHRIRTTNLAHGCPLLTPGTASVVYGSQEADAAHTIAQRGVILVGTAHGIDLGSLLKNPDLVRLVGGVSAVTLGDAVAAKSNSNKKVRYDLCLGSRDCGGGLLGAGSWVEHSMLL